MEAPKLAAFLPTKFRTDRLESVWADFVEHRRSLGQKPYQAVGLKKLAKMLTEQQLGPEDVPSLIEECMAGNWKGIPPDHIKRYRPSGVPTSRGLARNQPQRQTESVQDVIARRKAEHRQAGQKETTNAA